MSNLKDHKFFIPFHGLLLAISFLTRLPFKTPQYDNKSVWQWSIVFYPICGFIISLISLLPFIIFFKTNSINYLDPIAPIFISALAYLAISEWMTRMLHFDGFCDCMDSFSAMTDSKERRLEIMKDPHVGSSALGGGIILLLSKYCAVYYLMLNSLILWNISFEILIIALIATSGFARFAIVFLATIGKYPRKDGTAATVVGKIPVLFTFLSLMTLYPIIPFFGGYTFLLFLAITTLLVLFWKRKSSQMLGGVTGDVLGATCETVEVFLLLVLFVFFFNINI